MNEVCKFEFSLSVMGILTRSSTNPGNISINQKAYYAGIWPSKMKIMDSLSYFTQGSKSGGSYTFYSLEA